MDTLEMVVRVAAGARERAERRSLKRYGLKDTDWIEVNFMTNREAHEEATGMNLDPMFFALNGIDPDAEYQGKVPQQCYKEYGQDLDGCSRQENESCNGCRCLE